MKLILIVLGIVCFVLAAFKAVIVPAAKVDFFALGWAFLAAAVLLPVGG
jgi:hypothetical protein